MVNYSCEKCGKEFSQKGHYTKHLNKKNPCIVESKVKEILDKVVEEKLNKIDEKELTIKIKENDLVFLAADKESFLKDKSKFIGFSGDKNKPSSILVKNNNLHIDILIDPNHMIGKSDKASISDVIAESALSTIIDNEDSVAAVDGEDKVKCYRNWLGLMKGDLTANMKKNGKNWTTSLTFDRSKHNVRFGSGSFFDNLGDKLILDEIVLEATLNFSSRKQVEFK